MKKGDKGTQLFSVSGSQAAIVLQLFALFLTLLI